MKQMLGIGCAAIAALLLVAPASHAFRFLPNHWDVDPCKASSCSVTNEPFLELCGNDNNTWEQDAAGWGFWNWCREGSLSLCHYWYTAQCKTSQNWYGDDDWNEFDFVPQIGSGNARGETRNDVEAYSWPDIWTSDIKVRDVFACEHGVNPPTCTLDSDCPDEQVCQSGICCVTANFYQSLGVDQCLTLGPSHALTFVHEVGHAYGLDHDDTYASLMNNGTNSRHCSMGTGWREQPDGDSMAGAVELYGRNTDNIYNLTGAAYYRPTGGKDLIDDVIEAAYCAKYQAYNFTLMNVYKDIPAYQYTYRFVLVDYFEQYPTTNDVVWFGPVFAQNPSSRNTTVWKTVSVTVPDSVMLSNHVYRLWVWVDNYNHFAESDEQDNWIPLKTIFIRATSC